MDETPFNFDLERIQKSIESGVVTFPKGLGNARQQFLRDDNKRLGMSAYPNQYHGAEIVRGLVHG